MTYYVFFSMAMVVDLKDQQQDYQVMQYVLKLEYYSDCYYDGSYTV